MIKKLFRNIKEIFSSDFLKEYWESEKHGIVPEFPVIYYDQSIPHDFLFYDHVGFFYNEFIGSKPDPNEIIIDKTGRIFQLTYHEKRFRFPKITDKKITLEELKKILKTAEIEGLHNYLEIESVDELMMELKKNKEEHRK